MSGDVGAFDFQFGEPRTNASLLGEETSVELMKIFGGGRIADGQSVPLRDGKIKDTLRLTVGVEAKATSLPG